MENCLTCSDAKILFACDLDNTLIHSHKRRRTGDICVEYYVDQEQSFMSPKALDLLKKISERVLFVPVTTRSINQYRRIFWTEDFLPRYAVVANGAYFLHNDKQENFLREVVSPYVSDDLAGKPRFIRRLSRHGRLDSIDAFHTALCVVRGLVDHVGLTNGIVDKRALIAVMSFKSVLAAMDQFRIHAFFRVNAFVSAAHPIPPGSNISLHFLLCRIL